MSEHALVLETQVGSAGCIVTEPKGNVAGALVLLQGLGPPARAGVNAIWTQIARDLANLGFIVLRYDFAREGDSTLAGVSAERGTGWRRSTDLAMLRDIAPQFLDHAGEREILLVGSCHGGRVALEFAAHDPAARGLFLVTPYLWHREPHLLQVPEEEHPPDAKPVWANGPVINTNDGIVEAFRTALRQGPVWILSGGSGEEEEIRPFSVRLAEYGDAFEWETVPGIPLHPVGHPEQQARVRRRLTDRLARFVGDPLAAAHPS